MIPPHELKNKEFTRVMRGYSIPEVDEYISFVMEKYTELYRENDALERKLQSAMDTLDTMRAEEESIRTALINAQKAGKQIVADAADRADKIMRSTKSDCMRVLAEFRDKAAAERKTLLAIKSAVADLKQEMFEKYQEHISYLEQLAPSADTDVKAMQAVDNDLYAEKLADSIAELVREDFDFDVTDHVQSREDSPNADTQVFAKVPETEVPTVHHVAFDDAVQADAGEISDADSSIVSNDENDPDALFEELAAEIDMDAVPADELN